MGKTKTIMVSGEAEVKEAKAKKKEKTPKEPKSAKAPGLKGGERVVAVEAGPVIDEAETLQETKKVKQPKARGKKYADMRARVDRSKLYPIGEAVDLVKETSYSKFDGTVEMHLVVKKTGLSTQVRLPHSSGKAKKVEVAGDKTIAKLKAGKIDFDVLLATAEMMPKLVPFAKLLGPKGLMPNPKNGTLIKKVEDADKFSADSITVKTERKAPIIHTIVGRVNQAKEELVENTENMLSAIGKRQVVKAFIKPTMGPSIKLLVE